MPGEWVLYTPKADGLFRAMSLLWTRRFRTTWAPGVRRHFRTRTTLSAGLIAVST